MNQQNDEIQINLFEILMQLWRSIIIIILTAAVFGLGSGLYTHYMITPMYSSTSCIFISTSESTISYNDLMIGSSLKNDYMQLVRSRTVIENVIKNMGLQNEMSVGSLGSMISVSNPTDTRILNITVTYKDPRMAKEIVDELTKVSIKRISEIMDTKEPSVFEWGNIPSGAVSPSMKKNVAIAALFGLLLASVIVIVIYLMDDTIRSAEDIEKYLNLNTLASIPISEGSESEVRIDSIKRKGTNRIISKLIVFFRIGRR